MSDRRKLLDYFDADGCTALVKADDVIARLRAPVSI